MKWPFIANNAMNGVIKKMLWLFEITESCLSTLICMRMLLITVNILCSDGINTHKGNGSPKTHLLVTATKTSLSEFLMGFNYWGNLIIYFL